MMISVVLVCFIAAIIICIYTGYEFGKRDIVSNNITHPLILVGIIINCIYAYLISDLWLITGIIGYVLIIFILGYALWKIGVFGGGLVKLFTGIAALLPYPVTTNYINSNFSIGSEYSLFVNIILFILPFIFYVFYMIGISANYVNKEPNPGTGTGTGPITLPPNPPQPKNETPLVFISHYSHEGSRDKIIAHAICGELEAHGIKCWIAPRDILPGEDWDDAITDAIEECVVMIVIFSDNVNSSDYVRREVLLAADEGLDLITFRIEDALPQKGLKLILNKKHWLDAMTEPLNLHIQKLVKAVEALLEFKSR